MHGIGFELPLQDWFDFKFPKTIVADDYILSCLESEPEFTMRANAKVIWLGGETTAVEQSKTKKGKVWQNLQLTFHDKRETFQITIEKDKGEWLLNILPSLFPSCGKLRSFGELNADFETRFENFELFWYSKAVDRLKEIGLLVV